MLTVKITPNDKATPRQARRRRTALHRRPARWPEADRLRHLGTPHRRRSQRHVPGTSVLGQRRAPIFALLRPIIDATAQDRIRDLILDAYDQYEQEASVEAGWGDDRPIGRVRRSARRAVNEPGIVSAAYRQFHNYSIGNQLLAWAQCLARGIQPGPMATFPKWKELGRYVRKGEKAITLCQPVTVKRPS